MLNVSQATADQVREELNKFFNQPKVSRPGIRRYIDLADEAKSYIRSKLFGHPTIQRIELPTENPGHIDITTNPLDFLHAGSSASFSTCYRPGGPSFGGCTAFGLDLQTVLVMHLNKARTQVLGRFWVHVGLGKPALATEPIYGDFPETLARQAVNYIIGRIRHDHELPESDEFVAFKPSECKFVVHEPGEGLFPGYIDFLNPKNDGRCRLFISSTWLKADDNIPSFDLVLDSGLCLCCGNAPAYENGFCSLCMTHRVVCDACGHPEHRDFYHKFEGRCLCEACFSKLVTHCGICNRTVWRDNVISLTDYNGKLFLICRDCFDAQQHVVTCANCAKTTITSEYIGPNLKKYYQCDDCQAA